MAAVWKLSPVITLMMEAVAMICAPVAINKAVMEVKAVTIWEGFPYRVPMICGTVEAAARRK